MVPDEVWNHPVHPGSGVLGVGGVRERHGPRRITALAHVQGVDREDGLVGVVGRIEPADVAGILQRKGRIDDRSGDIARGEQPSVVGRHVLDLRCSPRTVVRHRMHADPEGGHIEARQVGIQVGDGVDDGVATNLVTPIVGAALNEQGHRNRTGGEVVVHARDDGREVGVASREGGSPTLFGERRSSLSLTHDRMAIQVDVLRQLCAVRVAEERDGVRGDTATRRRRWRGCRTARTGLSRTSRGHKDQGCHKRQPEQSPESHLDVLQSVHV